ncbi:uncharacterized protein LOC142350303 isoform X2 [Convolutriloba macropyga]|uniref:uncharacterized protein LOC142350303 isoform X2 n=1 Tax=Convolutriloba macropyga TaxID=536237 RepID=UPI003F52874B
MAGVDQLTNSRSTAFHSLHKWPGITQMQHLPLSTVINPDQSELETNPSSRPSADRVIRIKSLNQAKECVNRQPSVLKNQHSRNERNQSSGSLNSSSSSQLNEQSALLNENFSTVPGFDSSQILEIIQCIGSDMDTENHVISSTNDGAGNQHKNVTNQDPNQDKLPSSREVLPYPCSFCGLELKNFVDYFKHRKVHMREKPFKCESADCTASFNSEENLDLHTLTVHQLDRSRNQPGGTSIRNRTATSQQLLHCPKCDMTFNRVSKLRAHMGSHVKEEDFKCEVCGVSFEFLAEYEQHEYEHLHGSRLNQNMVAGELMCRLCKKYFLSKASLNYHLQSRCTHPVVKDHQPKFVRRKRNPNQPQAPLGLSRRERSEGRRCKGEKFACEVCGKSFNRGDHLRRHMVVHTKEKSFQCKTCGKSFSQKSSLSTHEKIHLASSGQSADGSSTGADVMIKCDLCERKFIQKHNYLHHLKVCHRDLYGEDDSNTLPCFYCNCTFNTRLGLSNHITRHHPDQAMLKERVPFVADDKHDTNCESVKIKGKRYRRVPLTTNDTVSATTDALRREVFKSSLLNSLGENSMAHDLLLNPKSHEPVYVIDSYRNQDEPTMQSQNRTSGPSNARSQPEDEFDKLIREGGSSVVRKHAPNDSMANLDLHLRRIGPTGNFEASICHYCGKEFSRACDLVRHIRKHTNEKPFQCPDCGKNFASRHVRDQHLLRHDSSEVSKQLTFCAFCNKVFATSQTLRAHVKNMHSTLKPFMCNFCDKNFVTKSQLEAHKRTHEKTTLTTLETKTQTKCQKEISHNNVRAGVNESLNNIVLKDPLLVTSAGVFKTLSSRKDHELTRLVKNNERFKFKCTKCGKRFAKNSDRRKHVESHDLPSEKQFKCTLCHDKFKTNVTLKYHILKHFRHDKKFKCDECPKVYSVKANLKWHKAMAHSTTKPFLCPYCGKSFKLVSLCKEHIKTHAKKLLKLDQIDQSGLRKNLNENLNIPEPVTDAIAVGDAHSSLKIIPKPDSKQYGSEVTLLDAGKWLEQHQSSRPEYSILELPQHSKTTETSTISIASKSNFQSHKSNASQEHINPGHSTESSISNDGINAKNSNFAVTLNDTMLGKSAASQEIFAVNPSNFASSEDFSRPQVNEENSFVSRIDHDYIFSNSEQNINRQRPVKTRNYTRTPNILRKRTVIVTKKNKDPTKPNLFFEAKEIASEDCNDKSDTTIGQEKGENMHQTLGDVDASSQIRNDSEGFDVNVFNPEFPNRTRDPNANLDAALFSPIKTQRLEVPDEATLNEERQEEFENPDLNVIRTVPDENNGQSAAILKVNKNEFRDKRSENGSMACPSCDKKYATGIQLKAHRVSMHGSSDIVDLSVKKVTGEEHDQNRATGSRLENDETGSELRKDKTWTTDLENPKSSKFVRKDITSAEQVRTSIRNFKTKCTVCHLTFSTYARLKHHFTAYHVIKPQCLSGSLSAEGPPPRFKDPDFIRISEQDAADIKLKMAQTRMEEQLNVTVSEKILLKSIDEIDKEVRIDGSSVARSYNKQLRMTQDQVFQCEDCPKAFSSRGVLKQHQRSHTGERPFQCTMCSKAYKTKSSYTYHLTSHLRTTKLFRCHLCKRQFVTPSSLSLHMRLHSGAAPLQCRFCPRKFTSSYKRQYHMEQVHLPAQMQARRDRQAELRKKRTEKLKAYRFGVTASDFPEKEEISVAQGGTRVPDAENNCEPTQIVEMSAGQSNNRENLTASNSLQTKTIEIKEASNSSGQNVVSIVNSSQYDDSRNSNYCPVQVSNNLTSMSTESLNAVATNSQPPIADSSEIERAAIQGSSYQFTNDLEEHNLWIRVPIVTADVQESESGILEPSLVAMTTDLTSIYPIPNVTFLTNNQNVYMNETNAANNFIELSHDDHRNIYNPGQVGYVHQQAVYGNEGSSYDDQSASYSNFEVNLPLSQRFHTQESLNVYEIEMDCVGNVTGPTPDQY